MLSDCKKRSVLFGLCHLPNYLFEVSLNSSDSTITSTQTGTKVLTHSTEFHHFILLLYGTFMPSMTLLCARFDTISLLLNELESEIHRAVCLCGGSRCRHCGDQCSPVERAQVSHPNAACSCSLDTL